MDTPSYICLPITTWRQCGARFRPMPIYEGFPGVRQAVGLGRLDEEALGVDSSSDRWFSCLGHRKPLLLGFKRLSNAVSSIGDAGWSTLHLGCYKRQARIAPSHPPIARNTSQPASSPHPSPCNILSTIRPPGRPRHVRDPRPFCALPFALLRASTPFVQARLAFALLSQQSLL